MCSSNTVRESSHISFFCGGDPYCEIVQRPENTHGELTGLLEWPVGLCLQSKITELILSQAEIWTSSLSHVFFCLWLVIGTYILPVFSGNLLIFSANGNICHSIHRQQIIFSFLCDLFVDVILPSSPSMLVYYACSIVVLFLAL